MKKNHVIYFLAVLFIVFLQAEGAHRATSSEASRSDIDVESLLAVVYPDDTDRAIMMTKLIMTKEPINTERGVLARELLAANLYYRNEAGDNDDSISVWEKIITERAITTPEGFNARHNLASALYARNADGDHDHAIFLWEKIIKARAINSPEARAYA